MNDLRYVDRVLEVLEQAQRDAAEEAAERAREDVDCYFGVRSTSAKMTPIEHLFLIAIAPYSIREPEGYFVDCQVSVGKYRVDFVVTFAYRKDAAPVRVAVECDGHDFHEKTKEQAEHDKKRDRHLTSQGYAVMRFTGRELWRDPFACADEVVDYTQNVMYEREMERFESRPVDA